MYHYIQSGGIDNHEQGRQRSHQLPAQCPNDAMIGHKIATASALLIAISVLGTATAAVEGTSTEPLEHKITALIEKNDLESLTACIKMIADGHAQLKQEDIRDFLQSAIVKADDKFIDQTKVDAFVIDAITVSQRLLDLSEQWKVMETSLWNEKLPGRTQRKESDRINIDCRLAQLVGVLCKSVLAKVDPHFDWNQPLLLNVRPPEATGLPAGVSPDGIADPVLRAQYKKSIEENAKRIELFNQQDEIKRFMEEITEQVANWIKLQPKPAWDGIRKSLSTGGLSEETVSLFFP